MSGKVAGSSTLLLQQSGQYVVCEHAAARETPGQKHNTVTFKDEADCCMKEELKDLVILGGFTGCLKKVLLFPVLTMFFHSRYNFFLLFGSVRSSRNANVRLFIRLSV